jgi:uncharacterized protein (DUF1697 family)
MNGEQYLALLRGINVGGKNIIKMSDLKECFENAGFTDVTTYIQSGNVIFNSQEPGKKILIDLIEKTLAERFNSALKTVLLSAADLERIINEAPADFGSEPDKYRYDVIFLKENVSADKLLKTIRIMEGVDTASSGSSALYFSRLISKASQSRLKYIMSMPEYQYMTIRNWNTTIKLLSLTRTTKG